MLRILVVDDSETNRRLAEVLVRGRGFESAGAADGAAALELLAAEPFDLVLLDGMMPVLDGPAVAREVRRREAALGLPSIPIVALTASVLHVDRDRMLDAGMDDYLAKPLRDEDLAEVLDRHLPSGTEPRTTRIRASVPVPGSTAPASPADPPADADAVVDRHALELLIDLGDARFAGRVVDLILADAAERVVQADRALVTGNVDGFLDALTALDGICGIVGASALDRRVRALRDEIRRRGARGEDPTGPGLAPTGLQPLLDATRSALHDVTAAGHR